ncbi:FAD:protein FMN transferase [Parapedobacter deserti]|uniref:FAD:protein FMN transferase n=1 Tax=Parapedobacter deserti TaxID=1912957 RepID=A0ABV7JG38_9SPHI
MLSIGFPVLLAGIKKGELERYVLSGTAQGTTYTVTYYANDKLVHRAEIDSVLAVIDSSMSLYKPYSLINKINAGGRGKYPIDEHFFRVFTKSLAIHKDSKGIFDITIAPLTNLWGFGTTEIEFFPDSIQVDKALACVGMDKLRLKGRLLEKKEPCVQLDMNGVAQGYSVDVLADYLEGKGITHYVVELGGELRVKGPKPDGTPVRIGIERPTSGDSGPLAINDVVEITEGAITTAGSYRNYMRDGNRKVSHHISPTTGYPFNTEIISATIYAKDAVTADGYDNVIMAMNADEAITFVNRRHGMEVFVLYIDESGNVRDTMSMGFSNMITSKTNNLN